MNGVIPPLMIPENWKLNEIPVYLSSCATRKTPAG